MVGPDRPEYCFSKSSLSLMSRMFALRLADAGIASYEIRPGIMRTDMTAPAAEQHEIRIRDGVVPARRWGEPEDVGRCAATLACGLISFSTGDAFHVDGRIAYPKTVSGVLARHFHGHADRTALEIAADVHETGTRARHVDPADLDRPASTPSDDVGCRPSGELGLASASPVMMTWLIAYTVAVAPWRFSILPPQLGARSSRRQGPSGLSRGSGPGRSGAGGGRRWRRPSRAGSPPAAGRRASSPSSCRNGRKTRPRPCAPAARRWRYRAGRA